MIVLLEGKDDVDLKSSRLELSLQMVSQALQSHGRGEMDKLGLAMVPNLSTL